MTKNGRALGLTFKIILAIIFILISLIWGFVGYKYYTDQSGKREPQVSKFLGRLFMLLGATTLIMSLHLFYALIWATF